MKELFFLAASAAATMGAFSTAASAAVLYEPFDYPSGSALATFGGTGQVAPNGQEWKVAGSTGDQIFVSSPGMTVPDLEPSGSGNAVTFGGAGQSNRVAINSDASGFTTGLLYYSLIFRIDDVTGTPINNGTGVFVAGLNNLSGEQAGSPSVVASRLRFQRVSDASTDFQIGIEAISSTIAWDPATYSQGDDIFVVTEYDLDNRVSRLWVNPDSSTFGGALPPPTAIVSGSGNTPVGGISSFLLRQASVAPTSVTIDEVRVDPTWAGVTPVPEPSAIGLLVAGAGAMLVSRRRA